MALDLPSLLTFALRMGASDIHLTADSAPAMRVQGVVKRLDMGPLGKNRARDLVFDLMTEEQKVVFERSLEIDFSYEHAEGGRFRVNAFVDRCGIAAVLRVVPSVIPTMENLGLPAAVRSLCERDSGLVLVTGPTGSGKSTTLASMLDALNGSYPGRIITVEDPIEFVHPSKRSIVSQRELGPHTKSFSAALRSALREDPDIILVGEMRDLETISLALTAAETGHLVFSTLHSPSAAQTIDRIIDVYPHEQQGQIRAQLAESLAAVLTQRLLPRTSGGRVAAHEVLLATPAVRAVIREGKTHQIESLMQVGAKDGMQTMGTCVLDHVNRGRVALEDASPFLPEGVRTKSVTMAMPNLRKSG